MICFFLSPLRCKIEKAFQYFHEHAKALEEQKRNRVEYLEFLKSCDFIKASIQWRKVQDRLETDERCSRLEKIDRLEIFQEYIRDLESKEEEQRKLRMEELRKAERKNRDEFRKLMEEHVTAGILNAKTNWRDYCINIKDFAAYLVVSSNTSGSTTKDLFTDVMDELEKQFVFEELLERAREKEEKKAKKRKRLADEFYEFLHASKEITASSKWEDCKSLFGDRIMSDEGLLLEIFDKFLNELKEKERKRQEGKARKEKEREKKKEKNRRDKGRGDKSRKERRTEKDGTGIDKADAYSFEEIKRSGSDRDKKHRKRHMSSFDDDAENEKDHSRSSYRHDSDHKVTSNNLSSFFGLHVHLLVPTISNLRLLLRFTSFPLISLFDKTYLG
ncbi:pre-mRNA-processing protein 40A-like [Capsicum annuum]|uniref:pre-mRNA-processing protein 40A-like n=1 Tax=Capsicum annuum TaxID=4072 RepID=UPI001FB08D54|nr:pre-mRNA-processing protein 40A-like [Capsicum annuum]